MLLFILDAITLSCILVTTTILSYSEEWNIIAYALLIVLFFSMSMFYTRVLWPLGCSNAVGLRELRLISATVTCGISLILVFTESSIAWAVSVALMGLFRPFNTAYISEFSRMPPTVEELLLKMRVRQCVTYLGFFIGAITSFVLFQYFEQRHIIIASQLGITLLCFTPLLLREPLKDEANGPPLREALVKDTRALELVSELIMHQFIFYIVEYACLTYAFVILLTEVNYVPFELPFAPLELLLASIVAINRIAYQTAKKYENANTFAVSLCIVGVAIQLVCDLTLATDSSLAFLPLCVVLLGASAVIHAPMFLHRQLLANAGLLHVSFVVPMLTMAQFGMGIGVMATIALFKWTGSPPYTLCACLLFYTRHSAKRICDGINATIANDQMVNGNSQVFVVGDGSDDVIMDSRPGHRVNGTSQRQSGTPPPTHEEMEMTAIRPFLSFSSTDQTPDHRAPQRNVPDDVRLSDCEESSEDEPIRAPDSLSEATQPTEEL